MNNFEKLGLEGIAKLLSRTTNCEDCVCWDICNDQKDCETLIREYLMEEVLPKIKACPFCGSTTAPRLFSVFETFPTTVLPSNLEDHWSVICAFNEEGCGASGKYCNSKVDAIKEWNKRATPNKEEWIEERKQVYDKIFEFIENDLGSGIFEDACAEDFLSKYFYIDADLCNNYCDEPCSDCWKTSVPAILASNDYITEVKEKCGE
jgi:hypothetical protein